VISFGPQRPFARSWAILQFAARATGPQNAVRKPRKIIGKSAPLARPRHAAAAAGANCASHNHPSSDEETRNPSRNSPPPLRKSPPNRQNRVSLPTRRNRQPARPTLPTTAPRAASAMTEKGDRQPSPRSTSSRQAGPLPVRQAPFGSEPQGRRHGKQRERENAASPLAAALFEIGGVGVGVRDDVGHKIQNLFLCQLIKKILRHH
jgi:hypothetical protein